ncbi:MAG: crossover junction endodeoxyribonuclease RuvC [SAR324 cluster bacterium]|nr:crossover junction endodeoxyribonuclease RuvC [SAR324 cluster bacterium]
MLIIGIDPGSRKTGYGIIQKDGNRNVYVKSGCIHLTESASLADRLVMLDQQLDEVLQEFQPECGSIESIFFSKNAKSALILGHARGVALLKLATHHLPVFEYSPLEVKQTLVGVGRASKDQVQHMVQILLNKKQTQFHEDESDALAIAITHSHFIPHLRRHDRTH